MEEDEEYEDEEEGMATATVLFAIAKPSHVEVCEAAERWEEVCEGGGL